MSGRPMRRLRRVAAAVSLLAMVTPALAGGAAPRPRPRSLEYRLSWGAGAVRADRAYRSGDAGDGVTVAMIDTGLANTAGLFTNLSPASTDLVGVRAAEQGRVQHGAQTAGLLAGALDGQGTFGVAYRATLLAIRADRDGSCRRECAFEPATIARGIDYAVTHGAKVIGLPLAAHIPLPEIEPAIARAAAAGVLIVAAAGNDGTDEPVWPARYAADPRFASAMIVAGASTPAGTFADWSNRAGDAASRFLAAPGQSVLVDCGRRFCSLVSGTSYSVAYVAGAAALVMGQHPAFSGADAGAALLNGARDLGRRGTDRESGRGALDVARALRMADRVRS